MVNSSIVSDLHFQPGGWRDLAAGLLGYLSFRVAGVLIVDGATLRSTTSGRLTVSWPERRGPSGKRHPIVRPVGDSARRAIEAEVIEQLGDAVPRGVSSSSSEPLGG